MGREPRDLQAIGGGANSVPCGGERAAGGSGNRRWWTLAVRMSRAAWTRGLGGDRTYFEETLLQFARDLEGAASPGDVEAVLLRLAREFLPDKRIELIRAADDVEAGSNSAAEDHGLRPGREGRPIDARGKWRGESMTELPLRCGGAVHGRLRIVDTKGPSSLRPADLRRTAIACTMAACALENLRQYSDWGWKCGEEPTENGRSREIEVERSSTVIRDATFLNAVFPFALGQAKRHREAVSLLCLAVDRLGAIQDLLGTEVVDRLVREICQVVAASIRSSDIVARLDDDRIIVLLIRARARNALHVAQMISRSVTEKTQNAAELGCATVSIGVAEFPGDARSADSLLEAADDALARAQGGGGGQVALAESRLIPCTASLDAAPSAYSPQ
jgi:diguanylate cyclase (GGDEF)-like protein